MGRASTYLKTALVMREVGLRGREKAGASTNMPMEASILESIKLDLEKGSECMSTTIKRYIRVTGRRTRRMGTE